MSTPQNSWDALALDKHGFIEASAGTGKTFTIENLVVRILTEPNANPWKRWIDLEEVLIVTYTEKATEELRVRIRQKLEARVHAPSAEKKPAPESARHIERCLTRFDRACIFTFHGFCNRFLTAHAFESRSPFGEEQADASELALRSVRDIIRGALAAGAWADCETMRSSLEKWGIKDIDDFCKKVFSVIQSYGSGGRGRDVLRPCLQAQTIVSRFSDVRKAYCDDDPDNHPFVNSWARIKAALNLRTDPRKKGAALKALLCLPPLDSAEQILAFFRQEPLEPAMIKKDPAEYFLPVASEESESYRSPQQVSGAMDCCNGRSFSDFVRDLGSLRAACAEHSAALDLEGLYSIIKDAQHGFFGLKQRSGIRTFDDMINGMHDVLTGKDDSMLSVLRKRFRYGIIDEFQDTNMLQWDIFRRIFVDDADRRPVARKGCLYAVGDPKQSIFSFQGSDVAVYHKALDELSRQGAADVPLKTNFRTTAAMVAACNALFAGEDKPAGGWFLSGESGIRYAPVMPQDRAPDVDCAGTLPRELLRPVIFKALYSVNESGLETRIKPDKERDLARWICSMTGYLIRLQNGRTPIRIPDENKSTAGREVAFRNLEPSDICILVEKHTEAQGVMRLFREKGISYTKQRNTGLFVSEECLHLLVMLDAVDRPADAVAVKKALLTRFFGVSPSDLGETPDLSADAWKAQVDKIRGFSLMARRRQWGRLFGGLFTGTPLLTVLAQAGSADRKLRAAAVRQLRNYCLRCLVSRTMTLGELVGRLRSLYNEEIREAEDENIFQKETEGNAVRILTMHSAKGLEFPIVFIAGGKGGEARTADYYAVRNDAGGKDFWLGAFGWGKALFERMRRQESRRLYYVALTRAKFRLFAPVWDLYDATAGGIVQRGGWRDAASASALFLSRTFGEAAERTENERLFSFVKDAPAAAGAPTPPSMRRNADPSAVSLGSKDGLDGAMMPSGRMTVQHSYSGMVRLAQKLGVRVNPGADEPQEAGLPAGGDAGVYAGVYADVYARGKMSEVLEPGAKTGNALHDILEQADFGYWTKAQPVADLCAPGSPGALLIDKCMHDRGLFTPAHTVAQAREAAAAMVANSLCAMFPDPAGAGRGDIMLGGISAAQRRAEAEFHFTFAQDRTPFPGEGRAIGGWVLGFIDLLFCLQSRYYLLDWKSNWIWDNDYSAASISKNMEQHRYDVQYRVYGLALHNWLLQRLPAYDPEKHFGGVIYVYLRGTRPRVANGIWTARPTAEELETEWPLFVKERLLEISGTAS